MIINNKYFSPGSALRDKGGECGSNDFLGVADVFAQDPMPFGRNQLCGLFLGDQFFIDELEAFRINDAIRIP